MKSGDLRGLTISEFGRRAGLSVKALRLYEASGLLPPAEVDAATGYRRYAVDQLDRARRISLLRQLDMPLAVIAEVMGDDAKAGAARLDQWWAGQEQTFQVRRASMGWLRTQLLATGAAEPIYRVGRRRAAPVKIASVRRETDQQHLLDTIERGEWWVRSVLDEAGAVTTNEIWVIYHSYVTPEAAAPVEICVPFEGAVEPQGDVVIRREPEQTQLYATVTRNDCFYPRIMSAYAAVETAATASGLLAAAPPREIYLDRWDLVAPADPFVHVALPVLED